MVQMAKKQMCFDTRIFRRLAAIKQHYTRETYVRVVREVIGPHFFGQLREPILRAMSSVPTLPENESTQAEIDRQVMLDEAALTSPEPLHSSLEVRNDHVCFARFYAVEIAEDFEVFFATVSLYLLMHRSQYEAAWTLAQTVVRFFEEGSSKPLRDYACAAKCIHLISAVYDLKGELGKLRPWLMTFSRRCATSGDHLAQAVCINWALRQLLSEREYREAFTLVQRAPWPKSVTGAGQHCRYLYYLARLHAVRLDYAHAHAKIVVAQRKAPQSAVGFRLEVTKLAIVVLLLLGEIPPRDIFAQKNFVPHTTSDNHQAMAPGLIPYAAVVQAVRTGDVPRFREALTKYVSVFEKDNNALLMRRLENNVIRVGLLRIGQSYSQIPLKDVASKLGLTSAEDAQCVTCKAIADGVLDGVIDPVSGILSNRKQGLNKGFSETTGRAFDERIEFCLQLYSDAVQAMQYGETVQNINESEEEKEDAQDYLSRVEEDGFDPGDEDF